MEQFITFLNSFQLFSDQEIQSFLALGEAKEYDKGECLVKAGESNSHLVFINKGIFRTYYYSSSEEEVTYCFAFPNMLLTSYASFITGEPSQETIEAITKVETVSFRISVLKELMESNIKGLQFSKILAEQEYLMLEKRFFQMQREKAEVRYLQLLENQPEYIQQIPLQYLATYLGITQRHLSRIRKEITN